MNAPIRVRLTLWYVLVLAAVMVALGAFVVTRLRSDLTAEVDRSLQSAAAEIARGYQLEGRKEVRDLGQSLLPGRDAGVQLLDGSGGVTVSQGDVAGAPLVDRATVGRVLGAGSVTASTRRGSPEVHLRTVAVPVHRDGQAGVLVATESLAPVDDSVHRVLILLLLGGGGALALTALGGWWIARKALMPVERMTVRAHRIGIDDLSERIALPPVRDEVGRLATTLNSMLDRIEHGVEARQRLVADASHELRAPLAAMRAELDVSLRQDRLDEQARAVLESARDEVVRMGRTVDNLLTLASVDEGRLELLVGPQDLRAIAEAAVRSHRAAADGAGVSVAVEGEPVRAVADRDRVHQVVSNLVDNAIRHAPERGHVVVRVWQSGGEAGVTVTDDGPGVPAEARSRIFERFARQDPARQRSGGAGLGLAICREIVQAHRGRIWVEPREPRGSAFVVALPLG
jgi:heavy metal sensor kinase